MKILVAMPDDDIRASFIPPYAAGRLEAAGEVDWNQGQNHLTPQELGERLAGVQALVTGWGCPEVTPQVLEAASDLRVIAHTGGSVAAIVNEAVYDRGITVLSGNEIYAKSVAEGVVAYMLASLRDIPYFSGHMQEKGWRPEGWWNRRLFGRTVGLIGFGAVARHLTPLLHAFEAEILVYADHVTPQEEERFGIRKTTLEDLIRRCDIVSLHVAKTPETHHMIGDAQLSSLRDDALFVNTARGACVDQDALARHAATGRFRVMLDVYEQEPLPQDSPLRGLPNVLLMPHMAGPTVDLRPHITLSLLEDMLALERGAEPKLAISRETASRMTRE